MAAKVVEGGSEQEHQLIVAMIKGKVT